MAFGGERVASIEARRGKFRVRWWAPDRRQQRSRTCASLSTAQELRKVVEHELAFGRDWHPEGIRDAPDLSEVMRAYIHQRSLRLRRATLLRYAENLDLFERFLRDRLPSGELPATVLSKALLEDFYSWLSRAENGLHKRARGRDTARKIVEVVQLFWQWAEGSDRWPEYIPRPRRIEMVRSRPQAVVAPSWAEMDAAVRATTGWHHRLAVLLRYTGLRVGESMLLERRDLNESRGTITIRPEISKTGMGRVIPVSQFLLEEIEQWKLRGRYLIQAGRSNADRSRQARSADFAHAWARAGVREEAWSQPSHAFRRGWKSGMLALGAHPDAVDYLQGHSLGRGRARDRYIDPWQALPLVEAASLVPEVGAGPRRSP